MAGTWTIQLAGTGENEYALDYLNYNADPVLQFKTQAASEFHLTLAGEPATYPTHVAFEALVTIRQNRVAQAGSKINWSNDTSANHYVFQGRLITDNSQASGRGQSQQVIFQDAWYDLEKIPFQQQWQLATGPAYFSRAYLFYDSSAPTTYLTVAQQVAAIIAFAASAGANLIAGIIEGPSQMPWYAVRGMSCAAAIKKCLECFPDLVTWIDGSTTPPTFNCRQRANLTAITLPYLGSDNGGLRSHKSSRIAARNDLVPSQVVLQYQKTLKSGTTSGVELVTDVYPAGSTGLGLRAVVAPIDLRGSTQNFANTTITGVTFDPTSLSWWQTRVKSLADVDIDPSSLAITDTSINVTANPKGIKVVDDTGAAIDYVDDYPQEMTSHSRWAAWTGINVIEATVSAYFTYTKSAAVGTAATNRQTNKISQHLHTTKIKLCSAPAGSTNYSTTTAYDTGETAITGLAQNIFASLTQLQYDGQHVIVEQGSVFQVIGPWNVLNLSGGVAAWATMNACIPAVEIDFFKNVTTITLGPAKHLSPQDLNNYLQFFRARLIWDSGNLVGGASATAGFSVAGDDPEEDSVTAHPQQAFQENREADTITPTNTNALTLDPANGQGLVTQLSAAGAVITTGKIAAEYSGAGAPAAGTLVSGASYYVGDKYFDTTANGFYRCTTEGSNSTSVWVQISTPNSTAAIWI